MVQAVISFCARYRLLVIFLVAAAVAYTLFAIREIRLDAIPDLSATQVIIYTRWDRSPDMIEDQVTYPIITSLLGAPKVKAIRGFSDFGFSYVYVIFQDGTDIYWARSRVVEYMQKISGSLPAGQNPEIGPDAMTWPSCEVIRKEAVGRDRRAPARSRGAVIHRMLCRSGLPIADG